MDIVLFRYYYFFCAFHVFLFPRVIRPTEKYGDARHIICVEINFVSIAKTFKSSGEGQKR